MEDSKGYYVDGELEAVSALEVSDRAVGVNGRVVRFTPLPIQKLVEDRLNQESFQSENRYTMLPNPQRSMRRYDRPKRIYALEPEKCRKLTIKAHGLAEAMELDKPA